jgi:hypothetical protein
MILESGCGRFSKKFENHCHALAIYFTWYNWIRIHKTLKVTPAMAAGLTDKLMDWADVVQMIDNRELLAVWEHNSHLGDGRATELARPARAREIRPRGGADRL